MLSFSNVKAEKPSALEATGQEPEDYVVDKVASGGWATNNGEQGGWVADDMGPRRWTVGDMGPMIWEAGDLELKDRKPSRTVEGISGDEQLSGTDEVNSCNVEPSRIVGVLVVTSSSSEHQEMQVRTRTSLELLAAMWGLQSNMQLWQ